MKQQDLFETVCTYGRSAIPMHMPGHKRNTDLLGNDLPYAGDITEIDGFDNLHDMETEGILNAIAKRASALYHAKFAFPLVNGSTGGILAAIRATAAPGDTVLAARNCHKSVYHAIELCELAHTSLLPPTDAVSGIYGSIRPEDVEAAFSKDPTIRAVILTSPTYEGVISDIKSIARTVHRYGATLIVDAAHGAHLPFTECSNCFPYDADIVITSLHKTLPSLTQTALALVYSENIALKDALMRELAVFESSSPSYILLSSIDRCIALLESKKDALFSAYRARLDRFYAEASTLSAIRLLTGDKTAHPDFFSFDRGKIVLLSRDERMDGNVLMERLRREHRIECEMAYTDYVLCMTSVCDTDENFEMLLRALTEIDRNAAPSREQPHKAVMTSLPPRACTVAEAPRLPPAPLSVGEIARDYAWVYPPGVPLVLPGEIYTKETDELLKSIKASGLSVRISR